MRIGTAGYGIGVTTVLNVRATMPSWNWEVLQAGGEESHSQRSQEEYIALFVPQAFICRSWHFAPLVSIQRERPLQGNWHDMPSSTLWAYPESRMKDTKRYRAGLALTKHQWRSDRRHEP